MIARCCSQTGFTRDFTLYQGSAPDLVEEESIGYYSTLQVTATAQELYRLLWQLVQLSRTADQTEVAGFPLCGHTSCKQAARLRVEVRVRFAQGIGRGVYDSKVDANSGLCVVRWYDNRAVQVSATHVAIHPIKTLKRWDNKDKKFVEVQYPAAITEL